VTKWVIPKGTSFLNSYAYVEFAGVASVKNSLSLNETMFKGRVLSVTAKRTNLPQFMRRGRGAVRGRGFRGRGRGFRQASI
jgi:polyadenylate-binding protein 2